MNTEPTTTQPTTDSVDTGRRNITKLALWTPPVMMTLMLSKRASAVSVVQDGGTPSSSPSSPSSSLYTTPPTLPTYNGY